MIQASANLSADDVSVPCRIRRSDHAENPKWGELENMTCTMRSWQPATPSTTPQVQDGNIPQSEGLVDIPISSPSNLGGSELLFEVQPLRPYTTTPVRLRPTGSGGLESTNSMKSGRKYRHGFAEQSPLRGRTSGVTNGGIWPSRQRSSPDHMKRKLFTVPIADIITVDVIQNTHPPQQRGQNSFDQRMEGNGAAHSDHMTITSRTSGFLEITFSTMNSYEILLAFLKANLPPERIVRKDVFALISEFSASKHKNSIISNDNTAQGNRDSTKMTATFAEKNTCADSFTASRIKERMKGETWTERMRRKIVHVAIRVTEASDSFSANCSCMNGKSSGTPQNEGRQIMEKGETKTETAKTTTHTKLFDFPDDLEFSQSRSVMDPSFAGTDLTTKNQTNRFRHVRQRETMDADPFIFEPEAPRSSLPDPVTLTKKPSRDPPSTGTANSAVEEENNSNIHNVYNGGSTADPVKHTDLKTSITANTTTNQQVDYPPTSGRERDINHSHHSNHSLRLTYEHMAAAGEYAI